MLIPNMDFHKVLYSAFFFNIDICNLFLWDYKWIIVSFVDDNTLYTSDIRSSHENLCYVPI